MSNEEAVRRPNGKRVHRESDRWYTRCALRTVAMTVRVPIAEVAPKDRCKRCWPTAPENPAHRPTSTEEK